MRRFLCMLLATVMVISAIPFFPALAETIEEEIYSERERSGPERPALAEEALLEEALLEEADREELYPNPTFAESSEVPEDAETSERGMGINPLTLNFAATRGRAAILLLMGLDGDLTQNGVLPSNRFPDVSAQIAAFPSITWAASLGWIGGDGYGLFHPLRYMTREEFVTVITRIANPDPSNAPLPFTDANQISGWAVPYVQRAVAAGLIFGFPDGTFRPRDLITRGDIITIITRVPGGALIADPTPFSVTWNSRGGSHVLGWYRIAWHALGPFPPAPTSGTGTFYRWTRDGGVPYHNTTMVPRDVTHYAQWRVNITWNSNGGHLNPPAWNNRLTETRFTNPLPNPGRRAGYMFAGWYTHRDFGVRVTENSWIMLDTTNLWARWHRIGWVTAGSLNVRSGPSDNHSIVSSFRYHQQVAISGAAPGWWQISDPLVGRYVHRDFIQFQKLGWVTASPNMHVRSGPGTEYTSLRTIATNAQVRIIGMAMAGDGTRWWRISHAGTTAVAGYVRSAYITPSRPGYANTSLNIHQRPSTASAGSGTLSSGTAVTVLGESNCHGWWRIRNGANNHYVQKGTNPNNIVWTQPVTNITITWNGNSGTPATQTTTRPAGGTVGTLPTQPTRTGHNFVGWYTAQSGGTRINVNTVLPNSNVTYWARWTPTGGGGTNTVRITWDTNTPLLANLPAWDRQPGTRLDAQGALPVPTWTRTFRGWNTTDGRTARGQEVLGSTIVPPNNVTYWGRWHDPVPSHGNHNGRRHMLQWYRSSTVTLRQTNFGGQWQTGIEAGAQNWTNSATPITVNFSSGSNNLVGLPSRSTYDRNWLGSFRRQDYSGTTLRQFRIHLYAGAISEHVNANPGFTVANVATSVMAHEIGHAVGLADNRSRPAGDNSIMNTSRNRNDVRGPLAFDRQSVNWLYR